MDKVAQLAAKVGLMKPGKVKDGNAKHEAKLQEILNSPEYIADEKLDGCRYKMVAFRFFSYDNVEKTHNFPHLVEFFKSLKSINLILDGEVHYPGKTSQYATQVTGASAENAIAFQNQHGKIHYCIYDILRTPKANWCLTNSFAERRRLLQFWYDTFVKGTPHEEYISLPKYTAENKQDFLDGIFAAGGEGIVLKKKDSAYAMGKNPIWEWMKVKQADTADLVVMGFEPPTRIYKGTNLNTWKYWEETPEGPVPVTELHFHKLIGKMTLGAFQDGELVRVTSVSGMTRKEREDMTAHPENYIGKVAKITYMELTEAGVPRHPVFSTMHEGKFAHECTWEQI